MRFLILTQYYPPEIGAPQVRLASMARELKNIGHDVEVVTAMPNYPTGKISPQYQGRYYLTEELDGIVVRRVWLYAATGAGLRRMLNYISFTVTVLWGLWQSKKPDYLFVESPPLFVSIPGFIAARLWKAKVILNISDLWPDSAEQLGLLHKGFTLTILEKLEQWSYRGADHITAVTEGIRSVLVSQKGVAKSKVLFLPNGANTEMFKPRPADVELAQSLGLEGQTIFLYAGIMGYAQGLETVLEAARYLVNRPDITIVLIGDGAERAKLTQIVQNSQLKNVRILDPGPLTLIARLYSLSRAGFVVLRNVPLFDGARPSKILPAWASGVPVLYSGAGEGARLVNEAQAGLVVPPENSRALADVIEQLADDVKLAAELGKNGRNYVEKHLSWSTLVNDWVVQLTHETTYSIR